MSSVDSVTPHPTRDSPQLRVLVTQYRQYKGVAKDREGVYERVVCEQTGWGPRTPRYYAVHHIAAGHVFGAAWTHDLES